MIEVREPKSLDGSPAHVKGPCRIYKPGDRITIATSPSRLVLGETDSVCLEALSAIMPLSSALCRDTTESWDYVDKIRYFCCPDVERPVIFKVERMPVEPDEVPLRTSNKRSSKLKRRPSP